MTFARSFDAPPYFSRSRPLDMAFHRSGRIKLKAWIASHPLILVVFALSLISITSFIIFLHNGLALTYNDARSHLDIGRRVVEGLKPGIAQLGSVWLPLPHALMALTIWNDFMWHSGLAGAIFSMIGFVVTGATIYRFLDELEVPMFGRLTGVALFAINGNILYLQSTAMTELLLLATMTLGAYQLLLWFKHDRIVNLIASGFWIMLSTLVRYDGWFLLFMAATLVFLYLKRTRGIRSAEGITILFTTLAGFGIALWFLWNALIFKDPLYFAFGPYSANTQQLQLEAAGDLPTKHHLALSIKTYVYALVYNAGLVPLFLSFIGSLLFWKDRALSRAVRFGTLALLSPLFFNILALYFGHSVLFIKGMNGDSWFNVRYGVMMIPSIAVFVGFLVARTRSLRPILVGALIVFSILFWRQQPVTIVDATVGSSTKNVSEVSGWLHEHAANEPGFILISAASHDAIIFSSGLPMKKFIHEGTGAYWNSATLNPDHYARWIVMRTHSDDDQTYRLIKNTPGLPRYNLVQTFPFADIYELKSEYLPDLITTEVFPNQR